jgi:hypothetical protein
MITPKGYSKDPNLRPDAIVLTLPVVFFEDRKMTTAQFRPLFERYMAREDAIWHFLLTNLPLQDVLYVYLVFDKHIQYRANFVQYERSKAKVFADAPDGMVRTFAKTNWVLFTGPLVLPAEPWPQRGFQGFRYATILF